MRKTVLLCLSAALAALVGCASSKPKKVERLPAWYESVPKDTESHLYSATMGESTRMGVALKKAKAQARADLAQQMGARVQNLEKLFFEEVGTDVQSELLEQFTSVTKIITSETLHSTQEKEKEVQELEDGIVRVYVLMTLPIGSANQALMSKLKANEHLYTRFRASQAFEELDADIKAYETARGP